MKKTKKAKENMCGGVAEKAFCNWSANRFHFTFPNGNSMSVVWGNGTYSDNYAARSLKDYQTDSTTFRKSDTVEVLFGASKVKKAAINKHFKQFDKNNNLLPYLTMKQFIWLFNYLSK